MADDRRRRRGSERTRLGIPQPEWGDNVVSADFTRGRRNPPGTRKTPAAQPGTRNLPGARAEADTAADSASGARLPSRGADEAGSSSENWAAGQVMRTATTLADSARLSRGRTYFRGGNVVRMEYELGQVNALVSGTQLEPFEVQIRWRPLTRRQVDFIVGECGDNPDSVRNLLAGRRPPSSVATVLFGVEHYLDSYCTCPDHATFCKHRVCVAYALAAEFSGGPDTFLAWRGIDIDRLLATVDRPEESSGVPGEPPVDPGDDQEATYSPPEFWGVAENVPSWEPLEVESGLDLGDTTARDTALRKFSWNNADQLRVLDTLTRCIEALTVLDDDDGGDGGRGTATTGRVFDREPWLSGPDDRSSHHD